MQYDIANVNCYWYSPIKIEEDLFVSYPFSQATDTERAAYKKQATEDWEQFLLMRAAELIPGK